MALSNAASYNDGANTRGKYRYQDQQGTGVWQAGVIAGRVDAFVERALVVANPAIGHGAAKYFVPGQVGLPDLQGSLTAFGGWEEGLDHPWHKLAAIDHCDDPPTIKGMTPESLLRTIG